MTWTPDMERRARDLAAEVREHGWTGAAEVLEAALAEIERLHAEAERLREFEWMYRELSK